MRQPGGAYSEFTALGASVVTPEDINNRGQIAGYFYDSAGAPHGFLATPVPEPASSLLLDRSDSWATNTMMAVWRDAIVALAHLLRPATVLGSA